MMRKFQVQTLELCGTSYEIGYELGKRTAQIPERADSYTQEMEGFGLKQAKEAVLLFDRWCPGITEELRGFADALAVQPEKIIYHAMTYLVPRCSQIAILPQKAAEGKPLLARNYEFNPEAEDFCLMKTSIKGKYTHMGTSVLTFGRDDGFNEHGLVVTMSSCGFPVGALPYMRAPKLEGLQFWAVIRTLLENCGDVEEALSFLNGMPIAFNINLMLLDRRGNAALFETLDGRSAVKRMNPDSTEGMICAANHAVLPELENEEPQAMAHSLKRYSYIEERLKGRTDIGKGELKNMLLSRYPDGLCCHYYEEFFGTTKSMVFSPSEGTMELCWGGRQENGWHSYDIGSALPESRREIGILLEKASQGTYDWVIRGGK